MWKKLEVKQQDMWKVFCSSNSSSWLSKDVETKNMRENKAVSERATDKQVHINLLYELQFAVEKGSIT